MTEVIGTHNTAKVFTDTLEDKARDQIKALCDMAEFENSKIRIMSDVHAGAGCTIGTTMTITDKVVPGMVGVDIGCGMETIALKDKEIDFKDLDKIIRKLVPSGMDIRREPHKFLAEVRDDLDGLKCAKYVNLTRAYRSLGTLGGGNHFIEVDKDDDGNLYLVIHSGSRHVGLQAAEYYQEEGFKALCGNAQSQIDSVIEELKEAGRETEIEVTIRNLKANFNPREDVPKDLAWVEGELFDNYIHDMKVLQHYAMLNRKAMAKVIMDAYGLTEDYRFTTIHNYIDIEEMILRKGSVSAKKDEMLLIPMNMRDGSLICRGKGNDDWNQSAPHGAGRVMSRSKAFKTLKVEDYKAQMEGIWSSCVCGKTIDESPMAYKPMDEIIANIEPTAEIVKTIRPAYNFKAAE